MDAASPTSTALVLSGGGARGAYEAGVIDYIRSQLPPEIVHKPLFNIYSGTSVGAINTAFLASTANDPIYQGAQLRRLWEKLSSPDIYETDVKALAGFLIKTGFFMGTNFFGLNKLLGRQGNHDGIFPFRCVLDTKPFVYYLRRNVAWRQIHRNIERKIIDAVTVSTTHVLSGKLVLFVEKHPDVTLRPGEELPVYTQLAPAHILASAAIPLIFPVVRINREFYADGSLRQNTPMSPAIHLGADRLLVVTVHKDASEDANRTVSVPQSRSEPTVGDVTGKLLDAVFLDKMKYDLEHMRRINHIIDDFQSIYGPDAMDKLNAYRATLDLGGRVAPPMRKINTFVIAPTQDIGEIASQHFTHLISQRDTLTPMQRFFAKVLESSPDGQNDLMSYLMFEPEFLQALIELGYQDARRQHDRLVNFFLGQPLDTPPRVRTALSGEAAAAGEG
jgi:NTE family protein